MSRLRRVGRQAALALALLSVAMLPSPAAGGEAPRSFTIATAGEILVHGRVADLAARNAPGGGYDFWPMLEPIEPWISSADFSICHFEGAISSTNTGLSGYPRFVAPHQIADAIAAAGWDACSTATNHGLDGGILGLTAALDALDERGIGHSGTARTPDERLPSLYDLGDVTIAHLAYSEHYNGLRPPAGMEWAANLIDVETILADASWARDHGAEFVVVSFSWGWEFTVDPSPNQRMVAEALLADPAVDLIVGHHAHVVQPIEMINDKYVVYGMGNHLSNQNIYWGPDFYATEDGMTVIAHVLEQPGGGFKVDFLEVVPTWVRFSDLQVLAAQDALSQGIAPDWLLSASIDRTWARATRLAAPGVRMAADPFRAISCEGVRATVLGTQGDDVLDGTDGSDIIVGRGGNDTISAWAGNDLICAGDGDDRVDAGYGRDRVWGGLGDDQILSRGPLDLLFGEGGFDTCSAATIIAICEEPAP